jgi:signal transduction histidine kinase
MFGSLGTLYDILIAGAVLIGVVLVFWNYRKVNAEEKTRYIYLLIGMLLSITIALITNVLITGYIENSPEYEFYVRLGVFGSVFMALFPGYAIIKHRLFNIKVIATEILSISILLTLFVQIFLSENLSQIILRGVIFGVVLVFVVMLVNSVEAEVRRKEELQKISDALSIANERLKELDMTKSEFISIASHQLRTPLTAIKGYISLILEGSYGQVPDVIQDVLEKVYTVNSRLVHLVEDLLNVSRIEAGRIQYSFAKAQLEPLIAELVEMFLPTAKGKNLSLAMQLPEKPLPQLTIDPNKIKEVLSNLIDNALKYTKEGGVTVSLEGTPKVARIIVSDTGIGIHPEDKKNLFEKFLRSKETTKMVVSGAGLGLYVGKSFIEAHGGKIWAESDGAGKGSRFIIELPLVNPNIHIGTSDQPTKAKASA